MYGRLGVNGTEDDLYSGRYRASLQYADNACRPTATAAIVIATSDVTDYHNDSSHTVLTSNAPGVAMATNCLCRCDDNEPVDGSCVFSARLGPSCRLKSRRDQMSQDYQTEQLVRRS